MVRVLTAREIDIARATAAPAVQASARAFGGQVSNAANEAMDGFGRSMQSLGMVATDLAQKRQNMEDDTASDRLAFEYDLYTTRVLTEEQERAREAGEGFYSTVRDRIDRETPQFVDQKATELGFRLSERGRKKFNNRILRTQYSKYKKAVTFENNARVAHLRNQSDDQINQIANRVWEGEDPDNAMARARQTLEANRWLYTPDERRKAEANLEETIVKTRIAKATHGDDFSALREDLAPGKGGPDLSKVLTSGRSKRKAAGWAKSNPTWKSLGAYERAAAMALMEADGMKSADAKNALAAMINRAARDGEDLGSHVSGAIYQPTIEKAQEWRLASILKTDQFKELTGWAKARAKGKEPDIVNGATHFLAKEETMLALEARNPRKYKSWRSWTGFKEGLGYKGVILRDGSHAFLAPEGRFETGGEAYKGPYRNMSVQDRQRLWATLESQRSSKVSEVSKEIKAYAGNATAGHQMPPEQLADLQGKVEAMDDAGLSAEFNTTLGRAQVMAENAVLPPKELAQKLAAIEAEFQKKPPTPEQFEMVEDLHKLASKQASELKDDALSWANKTGAVPVEPLDLDDPQSLDKRIEAAKKTSAHFGTPMQYFTKGDREAFKDVAEKGGGPLVALAERMIGAWGPEHTTQAIKEIDKDAPEAARAAWLLASGGDRQAALDIAAAISRRKDPNYKREPIKQSEAKSAAIGEMRDAFRNVAPQVQDAVLKSAEALYETRATKAQATEFDASLYAEAIRTVIGENTVNGATYGGIVAARDKWGWGDDMSIVLPPNVRKETWREVFEEITSDDLKDAGLATPVDSRSTGSQSGSRKEMPLARVRAGTYVQFEDGKYYVAMGDPEVIGSEQWMMGDDGQPFVFDLKKLEPILKRRRPDLFK